MLRLVDRLRIWSRFGLVRDLSEFALRVLYLEVIANSPTARNLKFYPLSLYLAIIEGDLHFVADTFEVETCSGTKKQFTKLSTWELLNLKPDTVLDIPQMLNDKWGISPGFIEKALDRFNIQTIGKGALEERFNIKNPSRYMLSTTRHYSWPKGAGRLYFLCLIG